MQRVAKVKQKIRHRHIVNLIDGNGVRVCRRGRKIQECQRCRAWYVVQQMNNVHQAQESVVQVFRVREGTLREYPKTKRTKAEAHHIYGRQNECVDKRLARFKAQLVE